MRLAVVDDHPILLDAVSTAVKSIPGDHTADTFASLEAYDESVAAGAHYDLVLLDLGLPGFVELAALSYFREWHDDTPVVVLSAKQDSATIRKALALDAMGFIPKTSRREVLIGAIKLVASGGIYIPPEAILIDSHVGSEADSPSPVVETENQAGKDNVLARRFTALTARQQDVLGLLLKGMPNKLICRQLGLSPNTVKSHVSAIFRALDVDSRTKAVIAAQKMGLRVDLGRPRA